MQAGDIVQITNEAHRWYPALVIVEEVKPFGIEGFIPILDDGEKANFLIRLNAADFEPVGRAKIF